MVLKCDICGEEITNQRYYECNQDDTLICEECGEYELTWSDDVGDFIYAEEDKEFFLDDDISDMTTFSFEVGIDEDDEDDEDNDE